MIHITPENSPWNAEFIQTYLPSEWLNALPELTMDYIDLMADEAKWTEAFESPYYFASVDSLFEFYPVCVKPIIQRADGNNPYDIKVKEDTIFNLRFFGYLRSPGYTAEWRQFSLSEIFLNRFIVLAKNPFQKTADVWRKHVETKGEFSQFGEEDFLPTYPATTIEQRFLGDAYLDFDHLKKIRGFWFFCQRRYELYFRTLSQMEERTGEQHPELQSIVDYLKLHESEYTPDEPQDEEKIAMCEVE